MFRYLKETQHLDIVYKQGTDDLIDHCDADYAANKNTRRSTTDYVYCLNDESIT